jgi:hypothetical protein
MARVAEATASVLSADCDKCFDDLAEKFSSNIYGTRKVSILFCLMSF